MEVQAADRFLKYFGGIRARTRGVIDCIPPDKIDWIPGPGKFSFADLIRHLAAIERYMFAENAQRKPSRYPGHGAELADGYDEILAYMDRMHAESVEIFSRLSEEQLKMRCVTPAGATITVWKWLRAMVEHEVHHRGQIYFMLGMLGVATPPLYGLTSEEVRANSLTD